jgi:hypothetical protein
VRKKTNATVRIKKQKCNRGQEVTKNKKQKNAQACEVKIRKKAKVKMKKK